MGYIRAEEILPSEIIELIQQYTNGTTIYIPRKNNARVNWGTSNDTRKKINQRNQEIYQEYLRGVSVNEIAEKYFLSDKSIWRIIRKIKQTA